MALSDLKTAVLFFLPSLLVMWLQGSTIEELQEENSRLQASIASLEKSLERKTEFQSSVTAYQKQLEQDLLSAQETINSLLENQTKTALVPPKNTKEHNKEYNHEKLYLLYNAPL